jgi:hypothetical protein
VSSERRARCGEIARSGRENDFVIACHGIVLTVRGTEEKKTANSVDVGGGIRDEFAAFV